MQKPMDKVSEKEHQQLFVLNQLGLVIQMDEHASLYWRSGKDRAKPLSELPWKYQLPFFLTFLRNDTLSQLFRHMEIIGAIDVFVKSKFFANEPLNIGASTNQRNSSKPS